jgi:hypothetical protein
MTSYRKIYEQHYVPIPKDEEGRTYEVHHINGDRSNNDPTNLVALSIKEHYEVHYDQGDWDACLAMSERMSITPEEKSRLAKAGAAKQLAAGTHPWQNKEVQSKNGKKGSQKLLDESRHPWVGGKLQSETQTKLVESGDHPWLGDGSYQRSVQQAKIDDGTHHLLGGEIQRKYQLSRVADGTHVFIEAVKRQLESGTHVSQKEWQCEDCGETGVGIGNYKRYHGVNCKYGSTSYGWENIKTGEKKTATRWEMIVSDSSLRKRIGEVIDGTRKHVKGWRIVK